MTPAAAPPYGVSPGSALPEGVPPRVFVVGAGRAGRSVAVALRAAGIEVAGEHGRARPFPASLGTAGVVLVATPDAAVSGVLRELADHPLRPDAVVLQLSGARAPDAADDALRARVAGVGTFHPLVPLADPSLGAERLRGAWVGVGGDAVAVAAAERLAGVVGAQTLRVPDDADARARYHAAAVFASNFPVVLAAVAERLFERVGVARDGARGAVQGLLGAAVANLVAVGDPAAALTGPVARGDVATVERHRKALATDADALALYEVLSREARALVRGRAAGTR